MYAIAGASGQLGQLVLAGLVEKVGADKVVALVRTPAKLAEAAASGVSVRAFDYDAVDAAALAGVERLLLISANEVGKRGPQHQAVIDAAKAADVGLIAYTSILHAPTSTIGLAEEHRATEAALAASGLPYMLLRNGWYNENYTGALGPSIEHGAIIGAAGAGRICSATRADYAAAAVAALVDGAAADVYELAGDEAFTMADFAAHVARIAGKPVAYVDMSQADYAAALEGVGLPGWLAAMLANSSYASSQGALCDDSHTLSRLIGRPTTPIADTIAAALA
ncbi:NAD(P)H-binding protein [Novosphingobium sp.]|uniref:NAD(P)H-binding protein n=1 Tax=Novosphingobium sp. TaxID=1874826 RepID=UPI002633A533|nr:NAD(P)H-binding protein [Novosphingobium sp.]